MVVVGVEADPVHVELLGAVNIGHRYSNQLDLPIHAQQPTRRIRQFSRPSPRPQVGALSRPSSSAAWWTLAGSRPGSAAWPSWPLSGSGQPAGPRGPAAATQSAGTGHQPA